MWHERIQPTAPTENGITADFRLGSDSIWFDGHFPDNPVLPGVAQLAMVLELIQAQAGLKGATVTEIRRVRFKQMITPDDTVTVVVHRRPGSAACFDFQILKDAEPACSGIMTVAAAK